MIAARDNLTIADKTISLVVQQGSLRVSVTPDVLRVLGPLLRVCEPGPQGPPGAGLLAGTAAFYLRKTWGEFEAENGFALFSWAGNPAKIISMAATYYLPGSSYVAGGNDNGDGGGGLGYSFDVRFESGSFRVAPNGGASTAFEAGGVITLHVVYQV